MRIPCSLLSHSVMSNSLQPKDCSSQASLSFTISWDLIKPMSIDLVMPSNLLILCHWLFFLPSTFPSIRVFSSEFALHIRCSMYWNFSFRISPPPPQWVFNEYWFPLGLTGWISLQSNGLSRVFSSTIVPKQHFFCAHFLYGQLSHSYMTTGKTIDLTRQTFVCKVMSLLFNILSRLAFPFSRVSFQPRDWTQVSWEKNP